jgi:PST family polysaccharide transporter
VAQFFTETVAVVQTVALARLLTPVEVGFFAAGSVFTSFLDNFVEGGLRSGLIHRRENVEDAAETVFWATLMMGAVLSLLGLATAPVVAAVFDDRIAGLVAAVMAGGLLLSSLTNVPEALLQRAFSVRRRLIVGPAVSMTFAVVSVSLAVTGLGVWSLVIGSYASYLVWVITLGCICEWRPGRGRASLVLWRELARYGFPLVLGLLGDRSLKVAQTVVTGGLLGPAALGFLRYGERIARMPVNAMIAVGSNSLFPAFAEIAHLADRMRSAFLRALGVVVTGGCLVTAALTAFGQPLVVVVLGPSWRDAGVVLVPLAGLAVGKAMATVSEEAIKGAGRTRLLNRVTALELVLGVTLLLALAPPLGLVGVGVAISGTALGAGLSLLWLARPAVGASWREVGGTVLPPVMSGTAATAVVYPLERYVFVSDSHDTWQGLGLLAIDGALLVVVYVTVLMLLAPRSLVDIVSMIRGVRAKTAPRGAVT